MKVTALCGGFGAARLVGALAHVADDLTCVVNVGDDMDYLGLRVCPDLDSVMYALAGQFNESLGWGPVDDSFTVNNESGRFGDNWFRLGDKDMALSLRRTSSLRVGRSLSDVTSEISAAFNVLTRVVPCTDDSVSTVIETDDGELSFQDFVVRRRCDPIVRSVRYEGCETAAPAPGVCDAIASADIVVIAPSNPVSSIGSILSISAIRNVLAQRAVPCVAVTPVVSRQPPRTPPEKGRFHLRELLMSALGHPHRAAGVAACYAGLIDTFVLDDRDQAESDEVSGEGVEVVLADTLARTFEDRVQLARKILECSLT